MNSLHFLSEIPKWIWLLSLIFFSLGVLSGYDFRGTIDRKRLLRRSRQLKSAAGRTRQSEQQGSDRMAALQQAKRFEETARELERLARGE